MAAQQEANDERWLAEARRHQSNEPKEVVNNEPSLHPPNKRPVNDPVPLLIFLGFCVTLILLYSVSGNKQQQSKADVAICGPAIEGILRRRKNPAGWFVSAICVLLAGYCFLIGGANKVTKAQYDRIEDGMSYTQVARIIGSYGEEMARNRLEGIPGVMPSVSTVSYSWQNVYGSNMNAMFQNDRLVMKAQFGLR